MPGQDIKSINYFYDQKNKGPKKNLNIFTTFRSFNKKHQSNNEQIIQEEFLRSKSQEKDNPGIGKVVSYIFKRTNSMTSANRRRSKGKMVSKLSWHRNIRLSNDAPKTFVKNFSLNDVLESAVHLHLFQLFLKSEYSDENLDFITAVKEYRLNPTREKSKGIFETFIQTNSLKEINIGFGVRKKVEEAVSKAEAKLFDEAYECIFKLLESDSFVRFKVFTNNQ